MRSSALSAILVGDAVLQAALGPHLPTAERYRRGLEILERALQDRRLDTGTPARIALVAQHAAWQRLAGAVPRAEDQDELDDVASHAEADDQARRGRAP